MVVRVRLRVRGRTEHVELPALVNSAFEADGPQLILPIEVAQELGLLEEARMLEAFEVAGGGRALGYRITRPVPSSRWGESPSPGLCLLPALPRSNLAMKGA